MKYADTQPVPFAHQTDTKEDDYWELIKFFNPKHLRYMSTLYSENLQVDFLHLDTAFMKLDGKYAPPKRALRLIVSIEDLSSGKKPMYHGILLKIEGIEYHQSDEVEKSIVSSRLRDVTLSLDLGNSNSLSLPKNIKSRNLQKEFQEFLGDCKRFEVSPNPMRDMLASLGGVFGLANRSSTRSSQNMRAMKQKIEENGRKMQRKQAQWEIEKAVHYVNEVLPELNRQQMNQSQKVLENEKKSKNITNLEKINPNNQIKILNNKNKDLLNTEEKDLTEQELIDSMVESSVEALSNKENIHIDPENHRTEQKTIKNESKNNTQNIISKEQNLIKSENKRNKSVANKEVTQKKENKVLNSQMPNNISQPSINREIKSKDIPTVQVLNGNKNQTTKILEKNPNNKKAKSADSIIAIQTPNSQLPIIPLKPKIQIPTPEKKVLKNNFLKLQPQTNNSKSPFNIDIQNDSLFLELQKLALENPPNQISIPKIKQKKSNFNNPPDPKNTIKIENIVKTPNRIPEAAVSAIKLKAEGTRNSIIKIPIANTQDPKLNIETVILKNIQNEPQKVQIDMSDLEILKLFRGEQGG